MKTYWIIHENMVTSSFNCEQMTHEIGLAVTKNHLTNIATVTKTVISSCDNKLHILHNGIQKKVF